MTDKKTIEDLVASVKPAENEKRLNAITWDDYFMGIALLSAQRSKDPKTQVGACIVDKDKKIIGIGYNGFPKGISDDDLSWGKTGSLIHTKNPYVVHAEANSIINAKDSVRGATMYVTLSPCNQCTQQIIQSGISEIVYFKQRGVEKETYQAARIMQHLAGVKRRKYEPIQDYIHINLNNTQEDN